VGQEEDKERRLGRLEEKKKKRHREKKRGKNTKKSVCLLGGKVLLLFYSSLGDCIILLFIFLTLIHLDCAAGGQVGTPALGSFWSSFKKKGLWWVG